MAAWLELMKKATRRPPRVVLARAIGELEGWAGRYLEPRRTSRLSREKLLKKLESPTIKDLWSRLANMPFATPFPDTASCRRMPAAWKERLLARAADALDHRVNLLGSGPLELGDRIDWLCDHKTGIRWVPAYIRDIDYNNPERPSDVKFPWELSRMQWAIPLGQAYLLTNEERYAAALRDLLVDWDMGNPYAHSVNWACTMECALRILTWTWFFHVFNKSQAWSAEEFRFRFLKMLYLHADFTLRHLEKSDVNGNHYVADATGLVFAGLFFGNGEDPEKWLRTGVRILEEELPKQVNQDGVDYEASVPYHRLVAELFLFAGTYLQRSGHAVSDAYRERLKKMALFTQAYTQPSGLVPVWGDADDARALPFGGQDINDHRYLCNLMGLAFAEEALLCPEEAAVEEVFWWCGETSVERCRKAKVPSPASSAFPQGGFYIMRNERDHVFIDCGPVGLAGRGGHGHNDCLSFEAILDGVKLVTDCGAYVYTASYKDRNLFRSTAYHNTPEIDGQEINRFISPDYLWNLHYDALPEVQNWETGPAEDVFCGSHAAYQRLLEPVAPVRTIRLAHTRHALTVQDAFQGTGRHSIKVPLHLAPGVEVAPQGENLLKLRAEGKQFVLKWKEAGHWKFGISKGRVSSSYGRLAEITRLCWEYVGEVGPSCGMLIELCLGEGKP